MINEFLDNVLEDFRKFIQSGKDLCKLRDTHFDAGRIPDYSDINVQQLYLLRYAYAYAFEYKNMYKSLLNTLPQYDSIEVTSIGCGSMVDYWALSRVVGYSRSINYRGIDSIEWYYRFPSRPYDSVKYYRENVIDFLNQEELTSDIYIFPKSISEFSVNEISQISNYFSYSSIAKDEIHFLFSLRTDQRNMFSDIQRTEILYNRMIQCGFHPTDADYRPHQLHADVQNKNIHTIDPDFRIPSATIDCLKELYEFCPHFSQCIYKQDCQSRLGRYPMLKCRYALWQAFSFERG